MKQLAILGSTGSIGRNTLEVAASFPGRFKVFALAANSNADVLCQQVKKFRPEYVCVAEETAWCSLRFRLGNNTNVLFGREGLKQIVQHHRVDQVVLAISGAEALFPLLGALESGKLVASANKEALVMALPMIRQRLERGQARIIPIDSEQSAIWQCLQGQQKGALANIYLTASGGPFRKKSKRELAGITAKQALKHPRWKMGRKISVDSATLMNKGLEVLEAECLFGVSSDRIKVVVHPEAVIHSMAEFKDGSILAQLAVTDMRLPIQYALAYPERLENDFGRVDFFRLKQLNFEKPSFAKFPCLGLAYRASAAGGLMPCVLNAANEVAVEEFLKGGIRFMAIAEVIAKVMRGFKNKSEPRLEEIIFADAWSRQEARRIIGRIK